MADNLAENIYDNSGRVTRPSLAQVKAIVEFMEKHPDLAHKKVGHRMSHAKFKKLCIELGNVANSVEGTVKSTKGWVKFWADKRRNIVLKVKQICNGQSQDKVTALEQRILDLCDEKTCLPKKRRGVKQEPCNGDDDNSMDDLFSSDEQDPIECKLLVAENEERNINMMEKLVNVMDQQASALSQLAQSSLSSAQAMEKIAQASHAQAQAVDRLAGTFESINASVHDVRNAILSIDYTMKRCFSNSATQHRQNSNLFS